MHGSLPPHGQPAPRKPPAACVPGLGELYSEHFEFVWRSALRLGVPESAVPDAVQDVFVVAHARLAEFEGRASIKTWLFAILRRVVRDHRVQGRQTSVDPAQLEAVADLSAASPLESAALAEAGELILTMLEALDDDKREAFVLAELEQLPMAEVAEMLGINVNTAYARVRTARAELERALARMHARQSWRP